MFKLVFSFFSLCSWLLIIVVSLSAISGSYDNIIQDSNFELPSVFIPYLSFAFWILSLCYIYFADCKEAIKLPFLAFGVFFVLLVLPGLSFTSSYYSEVVSHLNVMHLGLIISALLLIVVFKTFVAISLRINTNPEGQVFHDRSVLFLIPIVILCSIVIAFAIGYIGRTGTVENLIVSFLGSGGVDENVASARSDIYTGNVNHTSYAIGFYLVNVVIPISATTLLIYGLKTKNRFYAVIGLLSLTASILGGLSVGSRLQPARQLLFVGFVFYFFSYVKFSHIIKVLPVVFLLIAVSTSALGRFDSSVSGYERLVASTTRAAERIFLTKGDASVRGIEYVVTNGTWPRYGGTLFDFIDVHDLNLPYSFAMEVHYYAFGRPGTAGPQTFVEAYINGGIVGILIVSLYLFLILGALSLLSIKIQRSHILYQTVYVFIVFSVCYSGYSNLNSFFSIGGEWAIFLFFIYYIFIKFLGVVSKHEKVK